MRNVTKKLKKNSGFTLIEMLIVVAIIAILVAVSIPVANSALERARKATDAANERAAKAAVLVQYLQDGTTGTFKYDAENGTVVETTRTVTAYGKCSTHKGEEYILVTVDENGQVSMKWNNSTVLDSQAFLADESTK